MKKHFSLISLIIVPFLVGCNSSKTDMPKSPFKDHYKRIGMVGQFAKTDDMNLDDYNAIKAYINAPTPVDGNVSSYHEQQEIRDLKYAYFGKESSTVSRCSMTSLNEKLTRYSNNVFIDEQVTDKQIQVANGRIQKTKSTVTDYKFDDKWDDEPFTPAFAYTQRIATQNNGEQLKVTEIPSTGYSESDADIIFGLKPFSARILSHFVKEPDPDPTHYNFRLLADNNNAVCYKTKDDLYLIKEGYSLFSDFHTTMGRSYKAQDNYFYEGLLEKNNEGAFRFKHFRFYHELVILSKSFDGTGVPILYLDRPVIIEYSETTYSDIEYKSLSKYSGDIPDPTE